LSLRLARFDQNTCNGCASSLQPTIRNDAATCIAALKTPADGRAASRSTFTKEGAMLVLSRQSDETIVIGDNIRVTIVEVRGDKVRIGIDAPRDVTVHRQEIYDAIQKGAEGSIEIVER
jgi:carbon storage regulator